MNWTLIGLGIYGPICFTLGYYLAHRGFAGVLRDLNDVKYDVSNLQSKVFSHGQTSTPAPTTPAVVVVPKVVS